MTRANEAYRLSRVQAEGWNAARIFPPASLADLDPATIETLSPYQSDPERARWAAGFRSAFESWMPRRSKLAHAKNPTEPFARQT